MNSKTTSKVLQNQYSLKSYGGYLKLILHKRNMRPAGYEKPKQNVKVEKDTGKEASNISRARSTVWELAMCNEFSYFVTFTLNKDKMNRYDLNGFIMKLSRFIRDYRKKEGTDVQYLLVPEEHLKGGWHMHGLMNGIAESDLIKLSLKDNIPEKLKELIRAGRTLYKMKSYEEKFGWVIVEKIRNKEAIAGYMTKYINKNIGVSVTEKNKNAYYCSQGLKRSEVIKKGTFPTQLRNALQFDFENDYVLIHHIKEHELEMVLSQL